MRAILVEFPHLSPFWGRITNWPPHPPPELLRLPSTSSSHVFFPRARTSNTFFAHARYELARYQSRRVIQRKKVVLHNDYIPSMLDLYCI